MIKKEKITELKDKATKLGKDAAKAADTVKGAISMGVKTGKVAFEKAGQVVNKETLSAGLEATSKGVEIVANGASIASKGVGALAESMKKASKGIKSMSGKLKKP